MKPHPQNVDGDFYVEDGCCTACGVPMDAAPELFAYDDTSHCFVRRQPSTPRECDQMFEAIRGAELQCIRYRGSDRNWYERFAASGDSDICDAPPPAGLAPRIRNIVECDTAYSTLEDIADSFCDYLRSTELEHFEYDFKRMQSDKTLTISYRRRIMLPSYRHIGSYEPVTLSLIGGNRLCVSHDHDSDLGSTPLFAKWIDSNPQLRNPRWYCHDEYKDPNHIGHDRPW